MSESEDDASGGTGLVKVDTSKFMKYSSPRLVVDWMEELIVGLLLVKMNGLKCDLSPPRGARGPCTQCANSGLLRAHKHSRFGSYISF